MVDGIILSIVVVAVFIGIRSSVKHFAGKGGCCGGGDYKVKKKKLSKVVYKKTFKIEGMHCEHCKMRVEEIVNDIKGIAGRVNLKKGELTVSYEEDVDDELIKSRIEKAGYNVTEIINIYMKDNTNKNFWQKFAGIYTAFMSKNEAAYADICKELEKYIDGEKNVLELACGTGQITFLMADKAATWTATDYSENMVEEAIKRKENEMPACKAVFETADATQLAYEADSFDVVVIANALHIMPDTDAALKEIHRVLKSDGIIFAPTFVYEPGYSKPLIWLMEKAGFKTYHKWTREEFSKYVAKRNFAIKEDTLIKGKPLCECVLVGMKI